MNVVFTCGGTGGHINPAIAVANMVRQRYPDANILFIGAKGHMEEQLVPKAGFELKCVDISGISRGKSLKAMLKNVQTVGKTVTAVHQCKKILRDFKADVVLGTGGYACYPAVKAGISLKIPTCVHESNAMPGMTTRMLADKVTKMLVCFPESAKRYKHPEKVETVGMPIRKEFVLADKMAARRALGIGCDELVVVSAFGSLGARKMNEAVCDMLPLIHKDGFSMRYIHATGKFGWEWMPEKLKQSGIDPDKIPNLDLREYIYNMPEVMAAADVIISRAGASTCNEIAACGTPAILIPSPNVTDNHQEKNARVLSDRGGAVLLLEKDCTAQALYDTLKELLKDAGRRQSMSANLQKGVILDCSERIVDMMQELIK